MRKHCERCGRKGKFGNTIRKYLISTVKLSYASLLCRQCFERWDRELRPPTKIRDANEVR